MWTLKVLEIVLETYDSKEERNARIRVLKTLPNHTVLQYGTDEVGWYVKYRRKYINE